LLHTVSLLYLAKKMTFHPYVLLPVVGQFPDTYTAAVLRNPVISAGEMSSTDIPDWYYFEFGLDYPLSSSSTSPEKHKKEALFPPALPPLMSPETFERVYKASPITYVDKVRASVLLMIGASDLRVAPTQGMEYYHALKGRRHAKEAKSKAGEVEMLVFEGESHSLDGVEAARVGFEAARDFIADAKKRA
jgi:acylaminoacyl-peptidase